MPPRRLALVTGRRTIRAVPSGVPVCTVASVPSNRNASNSFASPVAPIQRLSVQSDRDPEMTRALQSLLADVAAGRESPVMTSAHATYFRRLPDIARSPLRQQLAGLSPLQFLACDEVDGKGIRI